MGAERFTLSRRHVLQGAGGLIIGLSLPMGRGKAAAATSEAPFVPNAFVRVAPDDTITVICKHIEFGQGPMTGLSALVAEEMDADWAQIRVESAPADVTRYANLLMGIQGTGGSNAMASSYVQMREAGATARAMLVAAAASEWGVPARDITVEGGKLRHAASKRESGFGAFAQKASTLPVPGKVTLKDPSQFKIIGRDGAVKRVDSAAKSNGTAQFGMDILEPGLLTVVLARPPRFGAKAASFDAADALAVPGVVAVKSLSSGIAVYAQSTYPALKARDKLKVVWDESAAEMRGTREMIEEFRTLANAPGLKATAHGDFDAAIAGAEKVVEAEFVLPYLAHAPMEPLSGYMKLTDGEAFARFGSQLQTVDQGAMAATLGLPVEKVHIETMFAGGSFGRRATATAHFAVELAEVAKAIGPEHPVKVVWTREDDIQGGYYRPLVLHRMKAGLSGGKIVAWSDTVVSQSIIDGTPFAPVMIKDGIDATSIEGSSETPYTVENFRCDLHTVKSPVPVLWWRSVGHTHTGFVVECFIDELLQATGQDPVDGRLALMDKAPREAEVLRTVAKLANWSGPGPIEGRARGVAVVKSFNSVVAQIAEVSIGANNIPKVHKVWCAVDCGVVVTPDVVRAQMESGIGYGLGHALFASVPLVNGKPAVSNFNTYRSLRMHEMPEVEVAFVPSTNNPTGVGEPGLPPIAPAVANAVARLTGSRLRALPMVGGVA